MPDDEVLIMTSTFVVEDTPFIAMRDPSVRLYNYLCSAVSWITRSPFDRIVLADNNLCGGLDMGPLVRYASGHSKRLEVVWFYGNTEAQKLGKGYGEGKTIEHVLRTSLLARNAVILWKTTGRLYVDNIAAVREAHLADANVIDPLMPNMAACDTRFFKMGMDFFRNHLLDRYKSVDDIRNRWIEHVYHEAIGGMVPGQVKHFSVKPVYVGWSGTNNVLYDKDYAGQIAEEAKRLFRELVP